MSSKLEYLKRMYMSAEDAGGTDEKSKKKKKKDKKKPKAKQLGG